MGTEYTLYSEALIDGKWHSIDFYQKIPGGRICLVPIISGKSFLTSAIRWYGLGGRSIDYDDLSYDLKKEIGLYGSEHCLLTFDYYDSIAGINFDLPEICGYFPADIVNLVLSGAEDVVICAEDSITPSEFRMMSEECQKGYRYFEYTEPFGHYDTMRMIKRSVEDRVRSFNSELRYSYAAALNKYDIPEIKSDVRVIIHVT